MRRRCTSRRHAERGWRPALVSVWPARVPEALRVRGRQLVLPAERCHLRHPLQMPVVRHLRRMLLPRRLRGGMRLSKGVRVSCLGRGVRRFCLRTRLPVRVNLPLRCQHCVGMCLRMGRCQSVRRVPRSSEGGTRCVAV